MKPKRDSGRRAIGWLRWSRRLVLLLLLAALAALGWLHQVGVPGFVKEPLLAQLRERGLTLQFQRMRLRLTRGVVAETVRLEGSTQIGRAHV